MTSADSIWRIAQASGLGFATCADLLRKGWVFEQGENITPYWSSPAARLRVSPPTSVELKTERVKEDLVEELTETIIALNQAIDWIKAEHKEEPYKAQYRDGRYILFEGLSAKAQALAALGNLIK